MQFVQGGANTVLYILSFTAFGGYDIQGWYWLSGDDVGWLAAWIGFCLGLYEYYWMFIFGIFTVTILCVGGAMLCCGRASLSGDANAG